MSFFWRYILDSERNEADAVTIRKLCESRVINNGKYNNNNNNNNNNFSISSVIAVNITVSHIKIIYNIWENTNVIFIHLNCNFMYYNLFISFLNGSVINCINIFLVWARYGESVIAQFSFCEV